MIEFKPNPAQYELLVSTQPLNLMLAGWGSAKTTAGSMVAANYISNFPNVRGMICANSLQQLNKSTLFNARETWKEFLDWKEYSVQNKDGVYVVNKRPPEHFNTENHNYDSYFNIISFENGAILYTGSLENYKMLDGLEIGYCLLDETKDSRESAIKDVILSRLRQPGIYIKDKMISHDETGIPFNPLYILTAPAKLSWINEMFQLDDYATEIEKKIFDKNDFFCKEYNSRKVIIASTYINQENLPANYIQKLIDTLDPDRVTSMIFGSPFSRTGGEFYPYFKQSDHVEYNRYNKDLPLHISFDENYVPYSPAIIFQAIGKKIWQIDEILAREPNNNIFKVCDEIKRLYPNHTSGCIVYGDATSLRGDPRQQRVGREKENLYTIIRSELLEYAPEFRLERSNPSVTLRRNFINTILSKMTEGKLLYDIEIFLGEKCPETIADFVFLKQASDGTKSKHKVKDLNTGITFEKYGHLSDAADYLITQYYRDEYCQYSNPRSTEYKSKEIMRANSFKY